MKKAGSFLDAGVALAVVLVGLDFFLLDFDVGFAGAHVRRIGAHGFLVEGGQREAAKAGGAASASRQTRVTMTR